MIAVIDNYDSFTWNLVDLLRQCGQEICVFRNDELTAREVLTLQPEGILISPGPGRPSDSGISLEILRSADARIPVLGICLGHQLIGEHFGMVLKEAAAPIHGKTSMILHDGDGLFQEIASPFSAMRYHSLILEGGSLPSTLRITAQTAEGEVMGIRHQTLPIEGLQFHPESILSPDGVKMIENWVNNVLRGNSYFGE